MLTALLVGVALLAFANGANDTFKGVATLHGGGTTGYRASLAWATVTTLAGCVAALWLAGGLASAFSGRGLLSPAFLTPPVATVICLSATAVILAATILGMPVSTTHALIGSLAGSAVVLQGWSLPWWLLGLTFALPLAASPLVSGALAWSAVRVASPAPCVCVEPVALATGAAAAAPALTVDREAACDARGAAKVVSGRLIGTACHFLSAGAVGFARGLNDAPKIAGILLITPFFEWSGGLLACLGLLMALGGILGARKVARTMSREITPMTEGQGLVANLVTSAVVIGASLAHLPVSTTHVSCGAIGGLGLSTGALRSRPFLAILGAWVVTLPAAALAAALLLKATL